jgi:multiple sugar transport system permease protein
LRIAWSRNSGNSHAGSARGLKLSGRQQLALFGPLAALLSIWLLGPALAGLLATFTNYAPGRPTIHLVGLANYVAVLTDPGFLTSARNVAIFTAVAVPAELVLGFVLAYLLRRPFRGRSALRIALLVPWLVSPIANGVMWHFLFNRSTGPLNFALGWLGLPEQASPLGQRGLSLATAILVEVWRMAPFVTFLLVPGLAAIPEERSEQAMLDGANWAQRIAHIALPSIQPLLLAVTLLLVGAALGTFDGILVLTGGGPGSETTTPALFSYRAAFEADNWPIGTTAGWLIMAAVLLVGLVYLKVAPRDES